MSASPVADGATEQVMTAIDLESLASGKEELNLPLQPGVIMGKSNVKAFLFS